MDRRDKSHRVDRRSPQRHQRGESESGTIYRRRDRTSWSRRTSRAQTRRSRSRSALAVDGGIIWMKWFLLLTLALAGCTTPDQSGVKVIVGAKLGTIDYSVVVIEGGKITA